MTPEERWKIEGRAREQCREVRATVVMLKADIAAYAERLKEAHLHLTKFLAAPTGEKGPTGKAPADYVIHFFRDLLPPNMDEKLRELAEESERLATLEKQVAEFD